MIFKTELYDHQQEAVDKLIRLKVGALLMEMGTGKTRTALEIESRRLDAGKIEHVIWLCPCSCKLNLKKDIEKHCGFMPDWITIMGIETMSTAINQIFEMIELSQTKRCALIVDESSKIKNPAALRTRHIQEIAKACEYKMILNGTLISRNEADIFSQFFLLDWRILGYRSYNSFCANHVRFDERCPDKIRDCINVDYLAEKIEPYSYQKKKSECLDLPEKTYKNHYFDLTQEMYDHYNDVLEFLLPYVDDSIQETIYRLFSCCQAVVAGNRVLFRLNKKDELEGRELVPFYEDPAENPRIKALQSVLTEIPDKAIIYCKYTKEINDISEVLDAEYGEGATTKYYGEMGERNKNESIERFEGPARFLIANKQCAGYGLNLQFCSYVIFYDNDFDFGTSVQAEDRVHRIGQQNNVHIINMVALGTIDDLILGCQGRKENLSESFKSCLTALREQYGKEIHQQECV